MSRDELQQQLQLKDRKSFRKRYLEPALKAGWLEMTLPDKPHSPLQQYRLTTAGGALKAQYEGGKIMAKATVPFPYKLVLNRFFLKLFGADVYNLDSDSFRETFERFKEESLELPDKQDGLSGFYHELLRLLPEDSPLDAESLLMYDANIRRHTLHINGKRQAQLIR